MQARLHGVCLQSDIARGPRGPMFLMEMVMEAHGMQAGIEAITRVNTSRGGSVLI